MHYAMKSNTQDIITRFPPSPTGPLHIGNVRTALFNYFFAKKHNGSFVVRVEDTDRARSKKEFEEDMLSNLIWLGIKRDGELWHQSLRGDVYKTYLQKLIDEGKAYISHETEGENKEVVRFKNPNAKITFTDLIRGEVTFDTTELKDFIIARNIHEPVYHLAVVIDDFETGVTHIIRGEDHVSNTPRQILIQEAIGAPRPIYAHLPLILAKDRSKLSKRKHGESVSLDYYRKKGYLPEALVNYMALLGWNPGTPQEVFTLTELIEHFDITRIQRGGAIFDEEKLKWFNREHILRMPKDESIARAIEAVEASPRFVDASWSIPQSLKTPLGALILERIAYWGEATDLAQNGEFDWVMERPKVQKDMIMWKDDEDPLTTKNRLQDTLAIIESIDSWNHDSIKEILMKHAESVGKGQVLWPLRVSLSGKEKSPDPFTLSSILGKEETMERIKMAIECL